MINILGPKRILFLSILIAANLALAAAMFFYLLPDLANKEREYRSLRGQISGLQSDVDRMQVEFTQLQDQQTLFEALQRSGFFSDQDRLQAERIFERIQKESNVISAVASVKRANILDDEEASKANFKILESPIQIQIEALDDVDVFRYIYLIETFFPGHITLQSLELERGIDVTGTILRSIASDNNPPLVTANIELIWRTMIPDTQAPDVEGGTL